MEIPFHLGLVEQRRKIVLITSSVLENGERPLHAPRIESIFRCYGLTIPAH